MIFAKVNPKYIIADHLRSLGIIKQGRRAGQVKYGERSTGDLLLFYVLPFIATSVISPLLGWSVPSGAARALTNTLSIFAPLLFNVLMLVFNMAREPEKQQFPKLQQDLIKEIYANTAYSIMVALITLVSLLLMDFWGNSVYVGILSFVALFGIQHFALTLFMVLKRMYVLLERHMPESQ